MTISLKKTVIGALAALSLGLAFSSPANAWGGGGWGWGPGAVAAGVVTGAVVGGAIANSGQRPLLWPRPGRRMLARAPSDL